MGRSPRSCDENDCRAVTHQRDSCEGGGGDGGGKGDRAATLPPHHSLVAGAGEDLHADCANWNQPQAQILSSQNDHHHLTAISSSFLFL